MELNRTTALLVPKPYTKKKKISVYNYISILSHTFAILTLRYVFLYNKLCVRAKWASECGFCMCLCVHATEFPSSSSSFSSSTSSTSGYNKHEREDRKKKKLKYLIYEFKLCLYFSFVWFENVCVFLMICTIYGFFCHRTFPVHLFVVISIFYSNSQSMHSYGTWFVNYISVLCVCHSLWFSLMTSTDIICSSHTTKFRIPTYRNGLMGIFVCFEWSHTNAHTHTLTHSHSHTSHSRSHINAIH